MSYSIPSLPLNIELETKPILKKLMKAHQALAELKGVSGVIPNQSILISTLSLQEAKDSSAIENIITTHDELYKSDVTTKQFANFAAKEVYSYAAALQNGYQQVKKTGLLVNNHILEIQQALVENGAGFRKIPGTMLKNDQTGVVVYTPPQDEGLIRTLMNNLEQFINDDTLNDADPLIKMAIIHHQFESIHPFYDGNGRTGRIINILYLVKQGLLDTPVLYLSRYINQNKNDYYRLLQAVRDTGSWEPWVLYMLEGIELTSRQTVSLILGMRDLMLHQKHKLRSELPKIYTQDLLNNLFRHPYTKIDFVMQELQIHRNTAVKYLEELVRIGLLSKHKLGKENFYLNSALFDLLANAGRASRGDREI
ncbi:Fic family protein [Estrella lausannensis]|uniref:Adenosine monophosphate-protein transferase SoFic n=1 Tax=Estrella lausannensis TaxID=483423 RepID=A0A0H5DN06_9BACT|nr:Fic family protein [Estrella lausannensis]CRX37576.1 Adenosine monophosphate-protein transferase SoFic [Estrella lausannensis]